jgi:hypothetical protein
MSQIEPPITLPEQLAARRRNISHADFETMQVIVDRLAASYPADWYQSLGENRLFAASLYAVAVLGMWMTDALWWAWLAIPFFITMLLKSFGLLFGREYQSPRWKHKLAFLLPDEIELIQSLPNKLKPVQQPVARACLPCENGLQFHSLRQLCQRLADGGSY